MKTTLDNNEWIIITPELRLIMGHDQSIKKLINNHCLQKVKIFKTTKKHTHTLRDINTINKCHVQAYSFSISVE